MSTRHAVWTGGRDSPQMHSDVYFVYLVNSVVKYRTSTVKQKSTYEECLKDLVLDRRFEPNLLLLLVLVLLSIKESSLSKSNRLVS